MLFDNDEDFESFALKPDYVIKQSEISGTYYFTAEFTDAYKKAVEDNFIFCIEDDNSKIRKRGVVTKGSIMLQVDNLEGWCVDEIKDLFPHAEIIDYRRHNKE